MAVFLLKKYTYTQHCCLYFKALLIIAAHILFIRNISLPQLFLGLFLSFIWFYLGDFLLLSFLCLKKKRKKKFGKKNENQKEKEKQEEEENEEEKKEEKKKKKTKKKLKKK